MPTLGDEFRAAREARDLSLSDVSAELHIRSLYLQAIEQEDWSSIGAAVYVRGFIRAYARFLGLDAESAVGRFNATLNAPRYPGPDQAARQAVLDPTPRLVDPAARYVDPTARYVDPAARYVGSGMPSAIGRRTASKPGPSPWLLSAAVLACALVAFVAYKYVEFQANRAMPEVTVTATSAADAALAGDVQSTGAAPLPVAPGAAGSGAAPVGKAHAGHAPRVARARAAKPARKPASEMRTFEVRLTDRSWLRVNADGTKALEGTFPPGTRREFRAHSVDVRAGNAGGVVVVVNGKDQGTMGASGEVVERSFPRAQ
jgi:cytoskeleton protein RodZ